jgi:protein gp37
MNKSKIEWCDRTWNPVTGCLHNCNYCYAKKYAQRFGGADMHIGFLSTETPGFKLFDLRCWAKLKGKIAPFPFFFSPTFHRYRLNRPKHIKEPQNVFVCSMADLFGSWVPDEWIQRVFEACEEAKHHRYLFLTKNPERYIEFSKKLPKADNFWFGSTITNEITPFFRSNKRNSFLSIEPIKSSFADGIDLLDIQWVIIGVETGNRKGKIIPGRDWIENIINGCREHNVSVFMKNSLQNIWKEPLIQEYPWDNKQEGNNNA